VNERDFELAASGQSQLQCQVKGSGDDQPVALSRTIVAKLEATSLSGDGRRQHFASGK
jgi:hypothetical protein